MVRNHVLQLRLCVAIKQNFRPYIRHYTSPNEHFEYSYPLIHCSNKHNMHLNSGTIGLNFVLNIQYLPYFVFCFLSILRQWFCCYRFIVALIVCGDSVFAPHFAVQYLVSFLVLKSSQWGGELVALLLSSS